jgi:hypothetical protein
VTKLLSIAALAMLLGVSAASARHAVRHDPEQAAPYTETWFYASPSEPTVWGHLREWASQHSGPGHAVGR